jgi:hypothetical protein
MIRAIFTHVSRIGNKPAKTDDNIAERSQQHQHTQPNHFAAPKSSEKQQPH